MPKIKTNNQPRPILYAYDLTAKELEEFDGCDIQESQFFRYKKQVFNLDDFMRFNREDNYPWDGYCCDSFFSATLVRFTDCGDGVIVATQYS